MLDLQQVQVKINIAVMKNTLIYLQFIIIEFDQCGFEMQTRWDLKFGIPTI